MAEWFVEEGIGEHRAICAEGGEVVAARVEWPGALAAGAVANAVLVTRMAGSARGIVRFPSGEEATIDGLGRSASEGAALRAHVVRAAIGEAGRLKRAQARPTDEAARPAPTLAERLAEKGYGVRVVHRLPAGDWDELFLEAWEGTVAFAGGSVTITPTPAMTLIDVDGFGAPHVLALSAVPAIAAAIRRFDLGGSIGIDFPTIAEKPARREIDQALADALAGWPHERTAMNGFGFVQLVARLERPSLLHRIAADRASAAARLLLRRAERVEAPGALLVTAHPEVLAAIPAEWRDDLARRTGRILRWRDDATLALTGGFAQAVAA